MTRHTLSAIAIAGIIAAALFRPLHAQTRETGVSLYLEEGKSGAVWDIALAADGRTLFSCGRDSTVKAWSLLTGECLRTMRAPKPTLNTSLALSPDGGVVAVGDMRGHITVWDAVTGALKYDIPAHSQYVSDIAITPSGNRIVSAGRDDSIRIWDAATGTQLRTLEAGALWVNAIAVSKDGTLLASAGQDGSVKLWSLASGALVTVLGSHSRFARSVAFAPDGATLLSGGRDGLVKVWDLQRKVRTHEFRVDIGFPHHLAFDRSGSRLAVSMMNGLVELWEWQRSNRVRSIPESYGAMAGVFDAGSADRLYTAHTDGEVKVWNLRDAAQIASLAGFSDGQWMAFTPDGYYDCSTFGDRYVQWRVGTDLYPLDRYAALYKQPAIVEDALAGTHISEGRVRSIVAPPVVEILSPRKQQLFAFGSEKLEIVVDIRAGDARKIESVLLLLNGRQLGEEQILEPVTLAKSDTAIARRMRIAVLPGVNVIEAVAVNAARVRSQPARSVITVETEGRALPNLFVLSVGVDQYAPQYPDLTFASLDARQLAERFAAQEGKAYTRVYTQTLLNAAATKKNVLDALGSFPQMAAGDMLVVFVSGHGVRARSAKGGTEYMFVTAGAQKKDIAKQGLSWEDVAQRLMKLKAGRVILLLDACHSGAVSTGASNEKVAASLANRAGIILASSSGNEYSFENRAWGHGAFTKALIDGLDGAADFTKNGIVDWSELQLYVTTTVKDLTRGAQTPMIPRLEEFANFDVARLSGR